MNPQQFCRHAGAAALFLLLASLTSTTARGEEALTIFRSGDELIVQIARLDVLRQNHAGLSATVKWHGEGKDKDIAIDLTDPAIQSALVIDLKEFGKCDRVEATIKDAGGKTLAEKAVSPVPLMLVKSLLPAAKAGKEVFAYIEPGTAMRKAGGVPPGSPRIALPDVKQLRQVKLTAPPRILSRKEITFPVVADTDFPLGGGAVVGRQSAAPDDAGKASLYISYKKGIYDGPTLSRWQKFLVEIPIQSAWGEGQGDESLTLAPGDFQVHITNDLSPTGRNILGASEGDLGQKGELDADEQGRIYWRVEGGGAYIVRFNPHTKKFEQPPIRIDFQKLVPAGAGLLNDNLCKVTCTRGRIYFTLCNDTVHSGDPGNALNRRLGGVFSIPQDWSNAAKFEKDIRLHVGSWETAQPTFYKTRPKADTDVRKLAGASVTEAGLFITTAGAKYEGGPWRLDLDANGNTTFFGQVTSLDATSAVDGTPLKPTKLVMVKGVPKGKELDPGASGLKSSTGELILPRSAVRLIVKGSEGLTLARASKHAAPTYPGAPQGTLTITYDLVAKLKAAPDARGALANSLTGGASLGPAFLVTPIPGEADKAIGVCEYTGYPLSVLDFSKLQSSKTVGKSFLPAASPESVRVGPYNSAWVKQGNEQWLYVTGYTGMSRIKYSQDGKPVGAAITADLFHSRLAPAPIDGHGRTSMKKVDGLIPVFGGRLIDAGYGLGGRGGDALSTGIELFDPAQLGSDQRLPTQTAAFISRCFALRTLQGRLIWDATDGTRRQEIFAASGSVKKQFINELSDQDKSLAPGNLDAKIFCYEVAERSGLHDLFAFSLPPSLNDQSMEGHIALSPCRRFLVILTGDGVLYSYSIAQKQIIDGMIMTQPSGSAINLIEFHRPSEMLFSSPDGQMFCFTAPFESGQPSANFNRISIDNTGRLSVQPHVGILMDNKDAWKDFDRIVRCFMPDLKKKKDGSYSFILGYSQSTVAPFVRVIDDFIPAQGKTR